VCVCVCVRVCVYRERERASEQHAGAQGILNPVCTRTLPPCFLAQLIPKGGYILIYVYMYLYLYIYIYNIYMYIPEPSLPAFSRSWYRRGGSGHVGGLLHLFARRGAVRTVRGDAVGQPDSRYLNRDMCIDIDTDI